MKTEFNPSEWLNKAPVASEQWSVGSHQYSVDHTSNPSIPQSFNPLDNSDQWSVGSGESLTPSSHHSFAPSFSEVDTLIARIEAELTDITTSYADWRNLGFAFAHEFGESGRKFYHRVSRFYNGYTRAETDKQYDQCLRSHGHGITIGTFFYLAKQAGVELKTNEGVMERGSDGVNVRSSQSFNPSVGSDQFHSLAPSLPLSLSASLPHPLTPSEADAPPEEQLPTLPDALFDLLPGFFQRVVARADSKEERDILLLGAMVTLGSCLNNISGIYDGNQVFPSLYLYIAARASSGKGRLVMCRNLVNPVHWEKRKQYCQEIQQYEVEMKEYNALKGKDFDMERPVKPPVRMHFIPANNTTAGFLQLIADNNGEGLILETEGDTIAKTLKSEIGDFSDALRKNFHHEMISCYRKTDREHAEIDQSRFSMILSSTFGQLKNLIPSTENGLASRFLFYYMNLQPVWKNVFAHSKDKSLKFHFDQLGQEFYSLYSTLRSKEPIEFSLSDEQQDAFNDFFARMQDKYLVLQGLDYLAIIRRLGLIAFRMMMILTAMRIPATGDFSTAQQCSEEDFQTALAIISVMVRHASYIIAQLPEEVKTEKRGNKKEQFFERLKEKFTRKDFLEVAKSLGITDRTSDNYIAAFCAKGLIFREQNNSYIKQMNT
jgi:hypothetical protein